MAAANFSPAILGQVLSQLPRQSDLDVLAAIMAGGLSKILEANCAVIGGRSVKDAEMPR
jgi:hypothetical protein